MGFTRWKIERTPFVGGVWVPASAVTLTSYYDPIVSMSLGDGRDSFKFKVINFDGRFDNYFQPNDKITISRLTSSTASFTSTDILMVGAINNTPETISGKSDMLGIEGYNFSESVMSALTFVDAQGLSIPDTLEAAVNSVKAYNNNFTVTWATTNPSLTTSSTSFPAVYEKIFNKPLKYVFEKYSTQQATTDGTYIWYVDNNNEIQWKNGSSTSTYSFNSQTDTFIDMKTGKDVKDVKNFIIIKGGLDPENKQIQVKYQDFASISKHGQKFYILVSQTTNAQVLNKQDLTKAYGVDANKQITKYPTFPFTTSWQSSYTGTVDGVSMTAGVAVTISDSGSETTNKQRYVSVLRKHVTTLLEDEAPTFAETRKWGKLKVDISFRAGQQSWGLGDQVNATIPKLKSTPFLLRVKEIQYTTDVDTYSLEEDIGSI